MKNISEKKRGTLLLIGGGEIAGLNGVFQKLIERIPGGRVAILGYDTAPNQLAQELLKAGAQAATTFIFENHDQANDDRSCRLMEFDALFLVGAHQQHFIHAWKGTQLERQIIEFFYSGKLLAATSAGAMLLGEVAFISKNGRVHPEDLFQNPFLQSISLETDFLNFLPDMMVDTHFSERGRLVRLLPLLARASVQKNKRFFGVGIDEETALVIEPDLTAEVVGEKTVTFLAPTPESQIRFQFPKPPVFSDLIFHRLGAGDRADLGRTSNIPDPDLPGRARPVSKLKNKLIFLGEKTFTGSQTQRKLPDFCSDSIPEKDTQWTVLTSPPAQDLAHEFAKQLQENSHCRIAVLPISENRPENLIQYPIIKQSEGIVLAGRKNAEELITFLRSTSPVAKTFRTRVKSGAVLVFLGEAGILAGRWFGGTSGINWVEGLNLLKNAVLISNLLDQPDQLPGLLERTYSVLFEKAMNLAILADNQNFLMMSAGKKIEFGGNLGTLVIDVSGAEAGKTDSKWMTWRNARLHLLHAGYGFDLMCFSVTH